VVHDEHASAPRIDRQGKGRQPHGHRAQDAPAHGVQQDHRIAARADEDALRGLVYGSLAGAIVGGFVIGVPNGLIGVYLSTDYQLSLVLYRIHIEALYNTGILGGGVVCAGGH
jgi:hypothetical protein